MSVSFVITPNDYVAFTTYQHQQPNIRQRYLVNNFTYAAIGVAAYSSLYLFYTTDAYADVPYVVLLGLAIALIVVLALSFMLGDMAYARYNVKRNSKPEHLTITLSAEGVLVNAQNDDHLWKWDGIAHIVETTTYIFVYISATSALIIPKRAFLHAHEGQDFLSTLRHFHEHARATRIT